MFYFIPSKTVAGFNHTSGFERVNFNSMHSPLISNKWFLHAISLNFIPQRDTTITISLS